MKKIAIPIVNNKLSAHFGYCDFFAFFTEEKGVITKREDIKSPTHQPGVIPKWIADQGATDIISGGMGSMAQQIFTQNNVNVVLGAPEKAPELLIQDFIDGKLNDGTNSCDHEDGHGNHHHH